MARNGRAGRTPKKDETFFSAVVESGGNVTKACALAGYSRTSVYEYKAADGDFAKRLGQSQQLGGDVLEQECIRRARDGVDEPVWYKGDQCGIVRKYSDTLAIFLLKGIKPDKYRERVDQRVTLENATPEQIAKAIERLSDNDLAGLIARRSAARGTD